MSKVVNLRQARKARARADKRDQAAGNSARFGQTKAAKEAARRAEDKAQRHLDGHKRSDDT